uniref:Cuticle protein n=1 Tax=Panagrolaimus sp. PS1159 TaxID=55785 RepID=A0AC35GVR6_9BILA
MKFLAIFFSFIAFAAAQYYYEAVAPAAATAPYVNTYNSYLPYASAASYGYYYPSANAAATYAAAAPAAAYPTYYASYGSNQNKEMPTYPPTSAKLTNNA